LLATKRRRRLKLLDAAASRVGASVPLHVTLQEKRKREDEEAERAAAASGKKMKKKGAPGTGTFDFLQDNIGRGIVDDSKRRNMTAALRADEQEDDEPGNEEEEALVLAYDVEDVLQLSEENRQAAFQLQYKREMDRQMRILAVQEGDGVSSPHKNAAPAGSDGDDNVQWEDG